METDKSTIDKLAKKAIEISFASNQEIDRACWIILHEYIHGFRPSEYDIREIDEDRYLDILKRAKELRQ